jgi:hypothetical protein
MRRGIPLLVVLIFFSVSCTLARLAAPTPTLPPGTPAIDAWPPTATPTSLSGGGANATPGQRRAGYGLEFTSRASSGFAVMHLSAHSCGELEGPWEGEVQIDFTFGQMTFGAGGPVGFSGTPGSRHSEGQAQLSGSGASGDCTLTTVSDPLLIEVAFSENGETAQIVIGSQGAGMLPFTCPGDPPWTGSSPFAMFWGPDPVSVTVEPYATCP